MDIETLLPVIAFVAITTGLWGVWTLFNKKSSRAAERLEEWRDPFARQKRESGVSSGSASVGSMFEKAAPALSKALGSKSELEQSNLKIRLANGGFSINRPGDGPGHPGPHIGDSHPPRRQSPGSETG